MGCVTSEEREERERQNYWELVNAAEVNVVPANGTALNDDEKALVKHRQEMDPMEITVVDDTGSESTIKVLSFHKVGPTLCKELKAFKIDGVYLGKSEAQDQEMSWEEQGIDAGAKVTVLGVTYFERDGSYYEGQRDENGKRHGHGKATFPDLNWLYGTNNSEPGIVYEGEFRDDELRGRGKFTALDPGVTGDLAEPLEGEWVHWSFGGEYIGERNADGQPDGNGKMTNVARWGDHSRWVYEGSWKNGKWDGPGILQGEREGGDISQRIKGEGKAILEKKLPT